MPFNTTGLVACLSVVGTILSASTASAAEPEPSPESHLARGLFQLAVINRDETRLLTATAKLAQLWDLKTGAMLQRFEGHAAHIHTCCFSPDERQVLTGAGKAVIHGLDDPSVRLWDVSTANLAAVLTTVGKDLVDDNLVDELGASSAFYVMTARYSPNGRQVLAVMNSRNSIPDAAVLWNLKTKEIDLVLPRISVNSGTWVISDPVQFSPDGKRLSGFVNEASQIAIWNVGTGDVRWRFNASNPPNPYEEQGRFGLVMQWSPSGKFLLAASGDRTVRVWNASTGTEIQRLQGHEGRIRAACFFSNETQVITASEDGSVRLWDRQSGEQLQRWDYPGPVQELSVSPDGHRLLTRTLQLDPSPFRNRLFGELRDLKSGELIRKWELPSMWIAENQPLMAYRSSVMSPSGRLVLTTVWADDKVAVVLLDTETGAVKTTY